MIWISDAFAPLAVLIILNISIYLSLFFDLSDPVYETLGLF